MTSTLNKLFKLQENGSSVHTEIMAGITTFFTMNYILFLNPILLSQAGMPVQAVFLATALSAAIASALMGFFANLPIALASGMGLNAYFTYGVVLGAGYSWQMGLAGVFVSACIFFILAVTGLRQKIINTIPDGLKKAVTISIGFFIAFIGLKNAGLVVSNPATFVSFGDVSNPTTIVAIAGLFITIALFIRKIPAALFLGMVLTAGISLITGVTPIPESFSWGSISISETFGQVFTILPEAISNPAFYGIIFAYLFVEFFDATGTLVAITGRLNLHDKPGYEKRFGRALIVDAGSNLLAPVLGTSSQITYIESLTGVESGGKTGLTAITVAVLFLLSIFASPFLPLVGIAATAPALILVGALMVEAFGGVNLSDKRISITTFFTVIVTLLSFSIAKGLAIGILMYIFISLALGKAKEISPIMAILGALFIIGFYFKLI